MPGGAQKSSFGGRKSPTEDKTTDPLFMKSDGQYYFYQNDHLGTPQKITAVNGAVVWSAKYSSFGEANVDPTSTIENNLRFPGQYFDEETKLEYNFKRYYNHNLGRYYRNDDIGIGKGFNHLFLYSKNNPIAFFDPEGLWCYTVLRMPLFIIKKDIDTKWNDWGRWVLSRVDSEGGSYPIPWLNAVCVCERTRSGTKNTTKKMLWLIWTHCIERCGDSMDVDLMWEKVSESFGDPASKTETERIAAGSFMNEASASIACAKKCRNLN